MMRLIERWLEARVQSIVTDRLIAFHAGMLERGEIVPCLQPAPVPALPAQKSPSDAGHSSAGCTPGLCPVLLFSAPPRSPS